MVERSLFDRRNFVFDADGTYNLFRFDIDVTKFVSIGTHIITEYEVGRPWITAYKIFRQPRLWWLLMKYNKIKRPETDMYAGKVISYPAAVDFYSIVDRYTT